MPAKSIYRYTPDGTLVSIDEPEPRLLVADSWLAKEGHVRALHLHRRRFLSSCTELAGIHEKTVAPFWEKALEKIPKTGLWFPRIELAGTVRQPAFQLRIRKAPPLHSTVRLIDCHIADFRKKPRHKGPDLDRMGAIRRILLDKGAEEGILTTPEGYILEGLTTNILWWENNTLCSAPSAYRILPGITGKLVQLVALRNNIPVVRRKRKLQDLNNREVWAVNALHGIRRAVNWACSPFRTTSHVDIGHWRNALENFNEKI